MIFHNCGSYTVQPPVYPAAPVPTDPEALHLLLRPLILCQVEEQVVVGDQEEEQAAPHCSPFSLMEGQPRASLRLRLMESSTTSHHSSCRGVKDPTRCLSCYKNPLLNAPPLPLSTTENQKRKDEGRVLKMTRIILSWKLSHVVFRNVS